MVGLLWELMADVEGEDAMNGFKTPTHCLAMAMEEFRKAGSSFDAERIQCCLIDQHIQDREYDTAIKVADGVIKCTNAPYVVVV